MGPSRSPQCPQCSQGVSEESAGRPVVLLLPQATQEHAHTEWPAEPAQAQQDAWAEEEQEAEVAQDAEANEQVRW